VSYRILIKSSLTISDPMVSAPMWALLLSLLFVSVADGKVGIPMTTEEARLVESPERLRAVKAVVASYKHIREEVDKRWSTLDTSALPCATSHSSGFVAKASSPTNSVTMALTHPERDLYLANQIPICDGCEVRPRSCLSAGTCPLLRGPSRVREVFWPPLAAVTAAPLSWLPGSRCRRVSYQSVLPPLPL
jgi:hypothetical protein